MYGLSLIKDQWEKTEKYNVHVCVCWLWCGELCKVMEYIKLRRRTDDSNTSTICRFCYLIYMYLGLLQSLLIFPVKNLFGKENRKVVNGTEISGIVWVIMWLIFFHSLSLIGHRHDIKMFKTKGEPQAANKWFHCKGKSGFMSFLWSIRE